MKASMVAEAVAAAVLPVGLGPGAGPVVRQARWSLPSGHALYLLSWNYAAKDHCFHCCLLWRYCWTAGRYVALMPLLLMQSMVIFVPAPL
jgi:hypothetical protein